MNQYNYFHLETKINNRNRIIYSICFVIFILLCVIGNKGEQATCAPEKVIEYRF